ncbi:guanylyl cyclase, ATPase, partial (macronuclear) [Tetrahymena thermophila SB210]
KIKIMEKQQKFNTICRNITEQNFCQFGNSCRYLHPGDVTTKVFIEKVDKKSKSKSKNSAKDVSENNQKQNFFKSTSSQLPKDNSTKQTKCVQDYSTQASMVTKTPESAKNTPAITYKLNSMNDGESLKDALKNEKGWRNKIKSQAKKITFEEIPEYAQTVLNPISSSIVTQEKQNCSILMSEQAQKYDHQINLRGQDIYLEKSENNSKNQIQQGSEAKLRQVNYKKQLERQLEGQFISIENVNQDLTLITKDKQVILYDQLIPLIEEDIELTEKFQIHSVIKLTHLDDIIKLFYDPQSSQLYILQLNQLQKKMKFYIIEEVYQYLTHYSKDFNLFFIIVVNIDKENIGFFPLPEKRECQYLEPIIVKNYNETIINFQKTEQTLNINLYKGVIIEEFQLISQEIFQEMRAQNGQSKEFNENLQDMIIVEQIIPQAKQSKKKMILSDSESENENDLEMSRYFQNKSSQNLLKYLSQSSTIQQDSEQNNKNSILNQSSILFDSGSKVEKKSLESVNKINSLQSTEASDIFSSPQTVSPKNENTLESQPKIANNKDKQQLDQKEQLQKNSKPSTSDRNNSNSKNKNKSNRSKTQPHSKKSSTDNKQQKQDEIKQQKVEQTKQNKESQNKNLKCQKNPKKQSQSLNRSKEVSNSVEKKKTHEKLNQVNNKINESSQKVNEIIGQQQKSKVLMNIEEDDLFPDENNLQLEQSPELKNNKQIQKNSKKNEENKNQSEQKIPQMSSQKKTQKSNKLSRTLSKINDNQNLVIDDSSKEIIQISISSSQSLSLVENANVSEQFKRKKQVENKKQTQNVDEEFDIENNLFCDTQQNKNSQLKELKKDKDFIKTSKTNKIVSKIKQKIDNCIAQSEFQMQENKKNNQQTCIQSDFEKLKNQEKHSQIINPEIRKQKGQDQNSQTKEVKQNQKNQEDLNQQKEQQKEQVEKDDQELSDQKQYEFEIESKQSQFSLQQKCNKPKSEQNFNKNQSNVILNQSEQVSSKLENTQCSIKNEQQSYNNFTTAQNSSEKSNNLKDNIITIRSDIILNKKKLQLVKYLKKEDIVENFKKMQIKTNQNILSESNCDQSQEEKSNVTTNQANIEKKKNPIIIHKSNYEGQKNSDNKQIILDQKIINQQPIKLKKDEPAFVVVAAASSEVKQNIKKKKIINMNKIKREELNNDYYDDLNSSNTCKYVKKSFEEPKNVDVNLPYQILSEEDFNYNNQRIKQYPPTRVTSMVGDIEEIIITDDEAYLEDDIEETILNEEPKKMYNNKQYDQQDKKNISFNQIPQFINQPQAFLQPSQQFNYQHQQLQSIQFFQPLQTNIAQNFTQNQIQYLSHLQQNPMLPLSFYPQCRGQNAYDFGFYNQHSFYQPPLQYNQQTQITDLELAQIELQKYQYIQQLIN